jgi:alkyldihydroxyacetonephosphate synthase
MDNRLKFYGWGVENTGLNEAEREQLFRFIADRLGVEPHLTAPPQATDIHLRTPRIRAPDTLAHVLTDDPHERLLHTYGKSYPETVRAYDRDFATAPDLVGLPVSEADVTAVLDWASGANVAVVPFGCGSSVVGGVEPAVGVAVLALIYVSSTVSSRSMRRAAPHASKPASEVRRSRRR